MKRILALAAALSLGTAALPAFAESGMKQNSAGASTGAETQTGTGAELGTVPDIDPGTTASTNANFGSVISAIRADKVSPAEIESMTDVSNVNVVRVDELTGADPQALQNALDEKQAQVDALQSAIDANSALSAQLDGQDVDSEDVVATEIAANGELTVYVHDDDSATDQ